jgi:hypothetical protein
VQATISNDGAKILQLLDIVHPAAKTLVDIARAQVRGCKLTLRVITTRPQTGPLANNPQPRLPLPVQDAEIGDGTTTVTLLAAELLRLAKPFVEDGVHPQIIVRVRARASRGGGDSALHSTALHHAWWQCLHGACELTAATPVSRHSPAFRGAVALPVPLPPRRATARRRS